MEPFKYFVFNKKEDYRHGYLEHIRVTERGLEPESGDPAWPGIFISRLLDSRKEGNAWHRAVIAGRNCGDDSVCFSFYCSDTSRVLWGGRYTEWEDLIESPGLSLEEKHVLMRPFLVHQIWNPRDVLLYRAKGRFLWVEIQLFFQAKRIPEIRDMKIYVQNQSFLTWLPEIYQTEPESDFLKRFLGLFETVYQELDEKIAHAARQLEPDVTEPEILFWMARWVGIPEIPLWPEAKLRVLLHGIVRWNLIRGTRAYMEHVIRIFTGETPFFVEYGEIEAYRGNPEVYRRLKRYYAHDPYVVNVLIRQQAAGSRQEQKALKKIIEGMKPAQLEVRLILLKPYLYLHQNVYVGINSVLGGYQTAELGGTAVIPSVLGRSKETWEVNAPKMQSAQFVGGKDSRYAGEKEEAETYEKSEKFSF